jgi:hypothetical protein
MDRRARQHAQNAQMLLASDLIFSDGLELTRRIAGHLETARQAERSERDARAAQIESRQAYVAGGAGLLLLLAVVGLAASGARHPESAVVDDVRELFGPRHSPSRARPAADASDAQLPGEPKIAEIPAPPLPSAVHDAAPATTLRSVADICTDFARIMDPGELPGLLERTAALLDASGIIVWLGEVPGAPLRPALSFGYSQQALAKMPSITGDDAHATAVAYRTGRMEIVRTNGTANGAIVAPLIASIGCVGVLSAEVRNGAECKAWLQALASIVAAQLAALVTPTPAATAEPVQELSRSQA